MTTEELAQQGALLTPLCPIISTYATDPMKMSPELKARLAQPESRAEYAFKFISQWTKSGGSGHAMNVWSEWLDVVNETVEPTELY